MKKKPFTLSTMVPCSEEGLSMFGPWWWSIGLLGRLEIERSWIRIPLPLKYKSSDQGPTTLPLLVPLTHYDEIKTISLEPVFNCLVLYFFIQRRHQQLCFSVRLFFVSPSTKLIRRKLLSLPHPSPTKLSAPAKITKNVKGNGSVLLFNALVA